MKGNVMGDDLLTPDLDGVPVDDDAEPADADATHDGPGPVEDVGR